MRIRALSTAGLMAVRAMRLSPLRTALSTLGVVVGVAALVAVLAVGDGVERYAREQMERTTDLHAVVVAPVTSQMLDHQRVPRTDYPVFTPSDAADLARDLPAGTLVSAGATGSAVWTQGPGVARGVEVFATDSGASRMTALAIATGRFFNARDVDLGALVAVISRTLADAAGVDLGGHLRIGNADLEVVGILKPQPRDALLRAFVPLTIGSRVVPPGTALAPSLTIKALRLETVPGIRAATASWLTRRYGDWAGRARVLSNDTRLAQARTGLLVFRILMGAITGISLIVGGIGIMNVLLASVAERTREIGVRRATGATRGDVLTQFLLESLAVTTLGSVLGVLLGLLGAFAVTALMRSRTQALVYAAATWSTVAVAVLAGATVGVVFGLYPALRAARLSPIEAIRHE